MQNCMKPFFAAVTLIMVQKWAEDSMIWDPPEITKVGPETPIKCKSDTPAPTLSM